MIRTLLLITCLTSCAAKQTAPQQPLENTGTGTATSQPIEQSPPVGGSGGDRDGDGVLDTDDRCPDEPEDRDGFQDNDGCPDPDNDSDGVLDIDDLCPNEPEPKDGYQDEDGCTP